MMRDAMRAAGAALALMIGAGAATAQPSAGDLVGRWDCRAEIDGAQIQIVRDLDAGGGVAFEIRGSGPVATGGVIEVHMTYTGEWRLDAGALVETFTTVDATLFEFNGAPDPAALAQAQQTEESLLPQVWVSDVISVSGSSMVLMESGTTQQCAALN